MFSVSQDGEHLPSMHKALSLYPTMYVNGKMRPVETIPGMVRRDYKGE
jgi:hypothetical protein